MPSPQNITFTTNELSKRKTEHIPTFAEALIKASKEHLKGLQEGTDENFKKLPEEYQSQLQNLSAISKNGEKTILLDQKGLLDFVNKQKADGELLNIPPKFREILYPIRGRFEAPVIERVDWADVL